MYNNDKIYIVVDIEANGPVPGIFSMLSIGAVATTQANEVSHFYEKLQPMDDAGQLPVTMAWWKTQPEAWQEVNTDAKPPKDVMQAFREWIISLGDETIFVSHPTSFDYSFISWYFWKFLGTNPFYSPAGGGRTLDLQSYASGKLHVPLSEGNRSRLPKSITADSAEHTHKAIDDARGYSEILRNLLKI